MENRVIISFTQDDLPGEKVVIIIKGDIAEVDFFEKVDKENPHDFQRWAARIVGFIGEKYQKREKSTCDCIDKIKENSLAIMQKQKGFSEVIEEPTFENEHICPEIRPYLPIIGKYRAGRNTRKFKAELVINYCPFCGERFDENE